MPFRLGAVAAIAFAIGALLVRTTFDHAGPTPRIDSEGVTESPAITPVATPEADPIEAPDIGRIATAGRRERDAASAPPAENLDAAPEAIPRRVGLGRVAYLQCEGATAQTGPFPCPRDRDLEAIVWAALEALPECPMMPTATGPGDLRLAFVPGAPVELSTRSRGPAGLPDATLRACLMERLAEVTTVIRADDLLVSFHFALIAR